MASPALPFLGVVIGAFGPRAVGRRWRAVPDEKGPRRRVLVLAPDGCVVGARDGIRTLSWSDVGGFTASRDSLTGEPCLVVGGTDRRPLCEVEARFLDAPLSLIVAVAEAYRRASSDDPR